MAVDRSTTDRVPPQSIEAETAVLGAALLDREAISKILELLDETTFYKQAHREIFKAMVDLYLRNEAVDLVTLGDVLRRNGQFEGIGGLEYLETLVESVPTSGNVEYHARIVLEKSTLRKLIESATEIVGRSFQEQVREQRRRAILRWNHDAVACVGLTFLSVAAQCDRWETGDTS